MPTSKKRKPKPSSQSLQKLTAAIVPTRRQREAYKATCPPETRTAQLAEARAIIGKEVFNERKNARIARAYRALALSPLCVDAYVALYAEGGYSDEGVDYLKRGIHAGELALQGLHPNEDAFWQHVVAPQGFVGIDSQDLHVRFPSMTVHRPKSTLALCGSAN